VQGIVVHRVGGPEVLTLGALPDPYPAPGEVRVRVRAAGVNFVDTERRRAVYGPRPLPWTPGTEAAGIVDAVGPGVDPTFAGRRVAFHSARASGTYAELATVPVDDLFHFPTELPFELMAALPHQGLAAYGAVVLAARVRAGSTVLVHAAAGGVGQIAVQLALRIGARVLGTVSSEDKAGIVRRLGAEPLAYGDDLAERVRATTSGRGVDVVIDSVGKATQRASFDSLAPFGELLFIGDASGVPDRIDVERLYERSTRVGAFTLRLEQDPEVWADARRSLAESLSSGALVLQVSRIFPLSGAAEAHRLIESRASTGKIVLAPEGR
jgi:NADPH2:quinone reductase